MAHNRRSPITALAAVLAISLPVEAAEWLAEPAVNASEEYNDNIRMTNADHNSVMGTHLDPRLKLSRRTELWDLNANGRVRASWYTGEDGLDTVDNFLTVAGKRKFERGTFEALASQVNDNTLQTEVLDIDTGITTVQVDRTNRSLYFTGTYLWAEDTWLEASVSYSTVAYDEGERFGLLDFDYLTPGLRIVHKLNPTTQLFTTYNHSKVDYEGASEQTSKTDSLQIGAEHSISEMWRLRGSAGSRRTRTSELLTTYVERPGFEIFFPAIYNTVSVPRDSETTGLVYDASLTRQLETGDISLLGRQSITPSSTGTDTETTLIELNGMYKFDAKLSARLAVSFYRSTTVGDITTQADSDRYRVAPSLNWQLDEELSLNAGYTYTRIVRNTASNDTVDGNAAFIGLGYSWPRFAISR